MTTDKIRKNVYLSQNIVKCVDELASKLGISFGAITAMALKEYCENHSKDATTYLLREVKTTIKPDREAIL